MVRLLKHKPDLKPGNVAPDGVVETVPIKKNFALVAKAFIYPLTVIDGTTGGGTPY